MSTATQTPVELVVKPLNRPRLYKRRLPGGARFISGKYTNERGNTIEVIGWAEAMYDADQYNKFIYRGEAKYLLEATLITSTAQRRDITRLVDRGKLIDTEEALDICAK